MVYDHHIPHVFNRDDEDDAEYNEEEPLAEDDLGDGADAGGELEEEEDEL